MIQPRLPVIAMKIAIATTKPSFLRRQESIFGVSPSVSQETQRPVPFSFQVVRVTTLMRYSERSEESKIHDRKTGQPCRASLMTKSRKRRMNTLC